MVIPRLPLLKFLWSPSLVRPKTYYVVPLEKRSVVYARIAPPGPGGQAGRGTVPEKPALGSTTRHSKLTAISNPVHPDNSHQTIIQASSPPNIPLPLELKLPNIVIGNPLAPPPPAKPIDLSAKATRSKPAPAAKVVAAPVVPLPIPEMKLAQMPAVEHPLLPAPPPPPVPAAPAEVAKSSTEPAMPAAAAEVPGPARDDKSLLSLSTDPSPDSAQIALPSGNKYGEFSISPAGTQFGSPGGSGRSSIGGATTGISAGGDGSTGVGSGRSGGGGGGATGAPAVSLKGPVEVADASKAYNKMVFAVPAAAPHVRKNAMVISAGPMGGGGLGVYRALSCARVFTVFLPMPTANWILQYCVPGRAATQVSASGSTTAIRMEEPLVPPSPIEKFDFQRSAISADKLHKNIILKGSITEDGSVANLHVYQGIEQVMDEPARIAFNRWKFAPAMRSGKPIAVEILVGIPSLASVAN